MKILKAVFEAQGDKPERTILFAETGVMQTDEEVRDCYDVTTTCLGAQAGEITEIDRSSMAWEVAIKSENRIIETDNVREVVEISDAELVELIAKPFVVGGGQTGLRCVRMLAKLHQIEKVFDVAMELNYYDAAEVALNSAADWIGEGVVVESKRLELTNTGCISFAAKADDGNTVLNTGYISLGVLLQKLSLGQRRILICDCDEAEFAEFVKPDMEATTL